jgi:hypothetical protein
MAEYKNRYAVYAHKKGDKKVNGLYPLTSEYVYDYCLVYAREQYKRKYPDYVIDNIHKA